MKTKRITKTEIKERALAKFMAGDGARLSESGLDAPLVAELAAKHAKKVADEVRPTPKQRAERMKFIRDVKAGKPPKLPKPPLLLRYAAFGSYFGPPIADRVKSEPNGAFSAFVNLDGKLHKLVTVTSRDTAVRIARVARAAAIVVFKHRKGDRMSPRDFAATTSVLADYPLGFKRGRGRMAKLEPITSGLVVARVGELLGKHAPKLPQGDLDKLTADLWSLPDRSKPAGEVARQMVKAEAERWRKETLAEYEVADVLTERNRAIIQARAKEYEAKMMGYSPEEYAAFLAEEAAQAKVDFKARIYNRK